MYMVVRKYKVTAASQQEINSKINTGFVPLVTKIKGFVDYYCQFPDDNTLITVSVFQDARGAHESVTTAADFVAKNLAKYFPEKPEIYSGEVFATARGGELKKTA